MHVFKILIYVNSVESLFHRNVGYIVLLLPVLALFIYYFFFSSRIKIKHMLYIFSLFSEFGEEISCEHGLFEESEVFEEPQEVAEEMKILQQKDFYLQAAKARQDAENLAVKLLATRLEYSFGLKTSEDLKFFQYVSCC